MGIEERVARLETHVEHMRSDIAEIKSNAFSGMDQTCAGFEKKMPAGFADIRIARTWDRIWLAMMAAASWIVLARVYEWI